MLQSLINTKNQPMIPGLQNTDRVGHATHRRWGFNYLVLLTLVSMVACDRQSSKPTEPVANQTGARPVTPDMTKPETRLPDTNSTEPGAGNGKQPVANAASKSQPPAVLLDAPEFALMDQTGAVFGSQELKGTVWIANFMFTRCTATCPRQTARFEELQQRVRRWPDGAHVRLISFTVDPENDTVERLSEYAAAHRADPSRWKFLTGSRQELWRVSKDGFKLPVAEAAVASTGPITHSPRFILVDEQSRIRGYYDGLVEDDVRKLVEDTQAVLNERRSNAGEPTLVGVPSDVIDPAWMEQRRVNQLATANEIKAYHDFQFEDRVEASGIRFRSRAVADATWDFKRNHYDHANGITVADIDGDGLHDIYFVSQVGGNELWRNLGQGRFENVTGRAGVALNERVGVTASFADTDNDGDPDLFVTTTRQGNVLFENDGKGQFKDISVEAGLAYIGHSSSADFFDYDRDGRLDLFVTNVGSFTTDDVAYSGDASKQEFPYFVGRSDSFVGHMFPKRSERSILYHNDGANRFRDASEEVGLLHAKWSGDATPLDANDDGWIDLYVVNMQGNDEYYENVDGKRFECRSQALFPRASWGGMCVKSFDYNNDGLMDLFTTNMHADMWQLEDEIIGPFEKLKPPATVMPESYFQSRVPGTNVLGNAFYEKQQPNQFREISDQIHAEMYWPWGHSVGDLNADGYQDIFITSCMNYPFRYHPNSLLLNDGGQRFRDAEFILGVEPRRDGRTATPWFELDCSGADQDRKACAGHTGRVSVWGALGSRSSVLFDLDQDGDLDVVTNDFNSPPLVLISNLSEKNSDLRYLKVQLQGTRSNRDGLGAKVQVTAGGKTFTQVCDGQSGYLSQSVLPLYFGLGTIDTIETVTVHWLGGEAQEIAGPIKTNQQLVVIEGQSSE